MKSNEQLVPIRLLVVDDYECIRAGVRAFCQGTNIEIVGEATDGSEGVKSAQELRPDAILLSKQMPNIDGREALHWLRAELPDTPVILYSADEGAWNGSEGGVSLVSKSDSPSELVRAIQLAHRASKQSVPSHRTHQVLRERESGS